MPKDQADDILRRHLESASPEERLDAARALLAADSAGRARYRQVPQWVIWVSRIAAAPIVLYYAGRIGLNWNLIYLAGFVLLPLAVVCFPNFISEVRGRFSVGQVVDKPSPPRLALLLAWLVLLVPVLVRLIRALGSRAA
jgi:hypothetical protein